VVAAAAAAAAVAAVAVEAICAIGCVSVLAVVGQVLLLVLARRSWVCAQQDTGLVQLAREHGHTRVALEDLGRKLDLVDGFDELDNGLGTIFAVVLADVQRQIGKGRVLVDLALRFDVVKDRVEERQQLRLELRDREAVVGVGARKV